MCMCALQQVACCCKFARTYSGWCSNLHTHPRQSDRQMARVTASERAPQTLSRRSRGCWHDAGARARASLLTEALRSRRSQNLRLLTRNTQRPSPHALFNATHSGCAKERSPDPSPSHSARTHACGEHGILRWSSVERRVVDSIHKTRTVIGGLFTRKG